MPSRWFRVASFGLALPLVAAVGLQTGCPEDPPIGDDDDTTDSTPDDCDDGYAWDGDECVDIDECAEDNGGCGDPEIFDCLNNEGAPPDCVFNWSSDWEALTDGVEVIESGGSLPSSTVVWGEMAFPVILDEANRAFVTAARVGQGRVFHVGHESHIGGAVDGEGDTDQLVRNAVAWVSATEQPVIGVEEGMTTLAAFLEGDGYTVTTAAPDALDGIDVYCTSTYTDQDDEVFEGLRAWLLTGGGLIAGGHAWYWGYGNDNAAENYPGNKMLLDAGLVITTGTVDAGTDTVGDEAPSELLHSTRALDRIGDHLDDSDPLDHDDQLLAAGSVSLAIDHLPLHWDYFDAALELSQTTPVVPTAADPVVPDEQPIESLVVHLDAKLAAELPADEVLAHPAGEDFPGLPDLPDTATLTATVLASYEGRDSRYLYSNAGADVWRSTGAWIPAGELVTVDIPQAAAGQGLTLLIGSHTDTLWSTDEWTRFPEITRSYPLEQAQTTVATAFGGLAYVRVTAGTDLGEIEIFLDGVVAAPRFVRGETDVADWTGGIRDLPAPWAELESGSFVLTVPSAEIRDLDDPGALMDLWQNILDAAADLAAIDHDRVRAERLVTDRQISAGWMHSGYPVMAHLDSAPDLTDLQHLLDSGDWGAFHELGHNHQLSSWLLPGTTEASVNLWSVYVYEEVLGISRDVAHSAIDPDSRATRIEDYLAGGADFWADWNVWTALETYLQLQEGFGWELYFDLFAEYNDLAPHEEPADDQSRIDMWVSRSSEAAGRDLGPFYLAWGFPVSPEVIDAIAVLPEWLDDPMAN